jgi:hypothetical protein
MSDLQPIFVSQIFRAFHCPGCGILVMGQEVRDALDSGVWNCGMNSAWPVILEYVIDEQVLA